MTPPLDASAAPRNSDLEAALAEARENYSRARPNSATAHEKARAVMPGGNTRTTLFYTPFPTAMKAARAATSKILTATNTSIFAANIPRGFSGIQTRAFRPCCIR